MWFPFDMNYHTAFHYLCSAHVWDHMFGCHIFPLPVFSPEISCESSPLLFFPFNTWVVSFIWIFFSSSWNVNIKPCWSVYELPAKLSLPVCLLPRVHRAIHTSHGPGKSNLFFNLFMKLAVPLQYLFFSFKVINCNWNMGLNDLHCSQMPISC